MFTIHKFVEKLFEVRWYMNEKDVKMFQDLLYVEFKKQDDYYLIKTVHYTYIDVILGLEAVDFTLTKDKDTITIKIM